MIHLSILLLNFMGFMLILPTMKRHKHRFVSIFDFLENITVVYTLRYVGFLLMFLALCMSTLSKHANFFVVAWFGWLTAAAGLVFVVLFVHESMMNDK